MSADMEVDQDLAYGQKSQQVTHIYDGVFALDYDFGNEKTVYAITNNLSSCSECFFLHLYIDRGWKFYRNQYKYPNSTRTVQR